MSHEQVMSHLNQSCFVWMSHVTRSSLNERHNCITYLCIWLYISVYDCILITERASQCHTLITEWASQLIAYEGVMSHMNKSRHIWMSHVTHEWVMSHMNESCHTWRSHVTWTSHDTSESVMFRMNESCHTLVTEWASQLYYISLYMTVYSWLNERHNVTRSLLNEHLNCITYLCIWLYISNTGSANLLGDTHVHIHTLSHTQIGCACAGI